MMAAPFRIQDAFAKAAFQAHGDRTGTFVDYHVAVIIDKAQRLVAGNRFTAIGNDVIAFESFLLQDIRLLLVIFRFFFRLFFFLSQNLQISVLRSCHHKACCLTVRYVFHIESAL